MKFFGANGDKFSCTVPRGTPTPQSHCHLNLIVTTIIIITITTTTIITITITIITVVLITISTRESSYSMIFQKELSSATRASCCR